MIKFSATTVEIDQLISVGGSTTVRFPFEGNPQEITHIQPGCGCTANCHVDGNSIVAVYTDQEATSLDPKIYKTHYPSGLIKYRKKITVFTEDKEDLYILNGMNKEFNPKKSHVELYFQGHVKL